MKRFFLILILTLGFQSLLMADDIRDFQIEGISIGDSLLNYMEKKEIKNNELNYFANKRKYYVVGITDNLSNFDQIEIYLRSNDKKYKIKTISGMIMIDNLNKCLSQKKKIIKDIDSLFSDVTQDSGVKANEFDKTGNSKQYVNQYIFNKDNHIRVECMQWSKKMKDEKGFTNTLNVVVMSHEISNWIASGYK